MLLAMPLHETIAYLKYGIVHAAWKFGNRGSRYDGPWSSARRGGQIDVLGETSDDAE